MRIAILLCDRFEQIRDLFESMPPYESTFVDMLNDVSTEDIVYHTYYVKDMQYPDDISLYDKYIITGSREGAYDNSEWINTLKKFVNTLFLANKKMIGICFGHQLLAEALGGKVQRNPKGLSVGKRYSTLNEGFFADYFDTKFSLEYHHGDCVVKLPKNAQCISSSHRCDIEAFVIEDKVLSFQGHPEFSEVFAQQMFEYSKPKYNQAELDLYHKNKSLPCDSISIAKIILDF